jgi:hypothetical protein
MVGLRNLAVHENDFNIVVFYAGISDNVLNCCVFGYLNLLVDTVLAIVFFGQIRETF